MFYGKKQCFRPKNNVLRKKHSLKSRARVFDGKKQCLKLAKLEIAEAGRLEEDPLDGPVQPHRRDQARRGDDDPLTVPVAMAEGEPEEQRGEADYGELAAFDAEIEAQQGRQELR